MEGLRFPTRLPCLPPTLEGSTQLGARISPRRAWLARRQARCAEATRAKVEAPSEFESETGLFHQACFTSCHQLPQACFTSCHQGLSPKPTHGFILVGFNRQGPTWRHNLAIVGRSHFGARVLTASGGLAPLATHRPEGHMWVIAHQIYGHIIPPKIYLKVEDGQGPPNRKIVSIV